MGEQASRLSRRVSHPVPVPWREPSARIHGPVRCISKAPAPPRMKLSPISVKKALGSFLNYAPATNQARTGPCPDSTLLSWGISGLEARWPHRLEAFATGN